MSKRKNHSMAMRCIHTGASGTLPASMSKAPPTVMMYRTRRVWRDRRYARISCLGELMPIQTMSAPFGE